MKTKIFVLNKDRTVDVYIRKNMKNNTVEINGSTYLVEPKGIFIKLKKWFLDKEYRLMFVSKDLITPTIADENGIKQINYLTNNTDNNDVIYQILLHTKVVKDVLKSEDIKFTIIFIGVAIGLLLGLIIGLSIGHVRL